MFIYLYHTYTYMHIHIYMTYMQKRSSLQDMCFQSDYRWHAYFKSIAVHVDFWLKAIPLHSPALLCISEDRSIASIAEHRLQWIMGKRHVL